MKRYRIILSLISLMNCFLLFACSNSNSEGADDSQTPSNLVINSIIAGATAQDPNGDGSGTVNFSITAANAASYKIDFGNGEIKEVTNPDFAYTYTASGTNTYVVQVTAYNGLNYITSSKSIIVNVTPKLVWSDEFDTDGLPNASKWRYDLGAGGWGNNEAQYYTNRPENAFVKGGLLTINTIKENYQGSSYTSARILTKGKFSAKYGRIEFRAKLPSGGGTWPALWMLGNNLEAAGWPACGEIDVMEHVGNQLNKIFSTLHYPGHSGDKGDSSNTFIQNATSEFHIYAVDWRAGAIKFYIDNKLVHTFINSANLPFNQDFFLIINAAIGGNFGGAIDPNFTSSVFEIDYVRVYN